MARDVRVVAVKNKIIGKMFGSPFFLLFMLKYVHFSSTVTTHFWLLITLTSIWGDVCQLFLDSNQLLGNSRDSRKLLDLAKI